MDGNATLDTFSESEAEEDDSESEGGDKSKKTPAANAEPARSVYAWSPVCDPCERCGTAVARRWRDGGELVCGECKDW